MPCQAPPASKSERPSYSYLRGNWWKNKISISIFAYFISPWHPHGEFQCFAVFSFSSLYTICRWFHCSRFHRHPSIPRYASYMPHIRQPISPYVQMVYSPVSSISSSNHYLIPIRRSGPSFLSFLLVLLPLLLPSVHPISTFYPILSFYLFTPFVQPPYHHPPSDAPFGPFIISCFTWFWQKNKGEAKASEEIKGKSGEDAKIEGNTRIKVRHGHWHLLSA